MLLTLIGIGGEPMSKWRSVSIYSPLVEKIEQLISDKVILYSNVNQFMNAVIEREVSRISELQNSD